jgi:pimeloyl-ACP methyl ester carboxylesterase
VSVPSSGGVLLAVHELHGSAGQPTLLVAHATGFHGRCYPALAAHLEGFHVIGFDFRGHGDTPAPDEPVDWQGYGDDAEAMAASFRTPVAAFGHSMGGAALLMAAHRSPSLFTRLVLFEPIVFPAPRDGTPSPMVNGALRRRTTFPSVEEAIANYASKPPMSTFTADSLDGYVRHGFRAGDDGVSLKCAPQHEAATYLTGGMHRTWDVLGEIHTPVLVIAGRTDAMAPSQIAAGVAERLPNGHYAQVDVMDHFGPMTHPAEVAAMVSSFVTAST